MNSTVPPEIDAASDPCYKLIDMSLMKRLAPWKILGVLTGALVFILSAPPDSVFAGVISQLTPYQSPLGTTIRNRSHVIIHYRISTHRSHAPPQEKVLHIGEVDGYSNSRPLDITFQRGKTLITYRLEPGRHYSFRYNAVGELELFEGSHGRPDAVDLAPYVTTPGEVVIRMLEMAGVNETDTVYDLGCGDGRIIIEAARSFGARGVGIDIVPERISESRAAAQAAGVSDRVEFIQADATQVDISSATVVTVYLVPESMELLRPILESRLNPDTRIISHGYPIPDWESKLTGYAEVDLGSQDVHLIYAYQR